MKKKYIILLLVSVFVTHGFAQLNDCGTIPPSKENAKEIERIASTFNITSSSGITYLPVKLHRTRADYSGYSNDTYYYPMDRFIYEFQVMNEKYLDLGFQFFLCDTVNSFVSNDLDYFHSSFYSSDSIAIAANQVTNAINVYYVNGSNIGGRSNFPSGDRNMNWMFVRNGVWQKGETLIHEMGHYLNLYHTFTTFYGTELVNGSNCSTHGDRVCDTPADVNTSGVYYDELTCLYDGVQTDGNGQAYSPLIENYMSYYGSCNESFTPGQGLRAQEGHAARLNLINAEGNQYDFSYTSTHASVPFNLRVFELNGQVRIAWEDTSSYPQLGYIVERSLNSTTGFRAIPNVSSNYYMDSDYTGGVNYYYRVKSVHNTNQYSNVFSFTPSLNSYAKPEGYYSGDNGITSFSFSNPTVGSVVFSLVSWSEPYSDESFYFRDFMAGSKYLFSWNSVETSETDSFRVWIDLNRNNQFEASEILVDGVGEQASDSLMIPGSQETNFYKMRFRVWEKETPLPSSHSRTLNTETKDVMLYIQGACTGTQEFSSGMYRFSGNRVVTKDLSVVFGYSEDIYGPGYEGWIYGNSSVELLPGFQSFDTYENFSIEINDCQH